MPAKKSEADRKRERKEAELKAAEKEGREPRPEEVSPVDEPRERPAANGFAIYDHAAASLGHVFLDSAVEDAEQKAEQQFARLHRHAGAYQPELSLVEFGEVAKSGDFYDDPDRFRPDDDEVPPVDRRL